MGLQWGSAPHAVALAFFFLGFRGLGFQFAMGVGPPHGSARIFFFAIRICDFGFQGLGIAEIVVSFRC